MTDNRSAPSVLEAVRDEPDNGPDAATFFGTSELSLAAAVAALLDQSDDCIKVVDCDGSLRFMNCNGQVAMQIENFADVAGRPWDSLWPADSQPTVRRSVEQALAGRTERFEAFCPTARGEPRWWEVTVSPLRRGDGTVGAILSTSRDISERRRREQELETIAAEMRHRLRNAHAIGAAIALAAAREAPEHRAFGQALAERLSRLADVQAQLLDVGDGIGLHQLCRQTLDAFATDRRSEDIVDGDDVVLGEQGARTLALVLGELATNSVKYGALGGGDTVQVSTRCTADELVLHWNELHSVECVDPMVAASSGQGAGLMNRIVALSGGTLDGAAQPGGYRAILTLPRASFTE